MNKIEHRLFSHITMNWRGRPLTSHEVVVNSIAATRTRTGLTVAAELDTNAYPLGVTVSAERMSMLPIVPHTERGAWNYTISPADSHPHPPVCDDRARIRSESLHALADPRLTGTRRCVVCGGRLPTGSTGRRRYCSAACGMRDFDSRTRTLQLVHHERDRHPAAVVDWGCQEN